MNETDPSNEDTATQATPGSPQRRLYCAPVLKVWGAVSDLTNGATGPYQDGAGANTSSAATQA